MRHFFRPRARRLMALPVLLLAVLAAVGAVVGAQDPPSWLAWLPPWLAAVGAAVLGVVGTWAAEPWASRRKDSSGRDRETVEALRRHLGRQRGLRRMADMAPLALRVHPAVDLQEVDQQDRADRDRADGDLPSFVARKVEPGVREWLAGARGTGGFLLLVGESSVGKTRLLYEAAKAVLPDFFVLAPDLGDGGLLTRIVETPVPLPKTIVWLDELQRFLDGPYLAPGSSPVTAATVRRLLDAPTPVVLLATMWPAYAAALRASDPGATGVGGVARYPNAADVLAERRLREVTVKTFSDKERRHAATLARRDRRLQLALDDADYNVTEVLAGAPRLVGRYEQGSTG
jgi:hypothetical protein